MLENTLKAQVYLTDPRTDKEPVTVEVILTRRDRLQLIEGGEEKPVYKFLHNGQQCFAAQLKTDTHGTIWLVLDWLEERSGR